MPYPRDEIQATVERYVETRKVIDAGGATWGALAQYFTDDAVFIDPAWGRVEGIEEMKATVFGDAMVGFEEWTFPVEFYAIDGDNVIIKWKQVLPGRRADGRPYEQSGVSTLDLRRATASSATRRTSSTWCTCSRTCARASARFPTSRCRPSTPTATSPAPNA